LSGQTNVLATVACMTALLLAILGSVWRSQPIMLIALVLSIVGNDALAILAGQGLTERVVILGIEGISFWWAGFGFRMRTSPTGVGRRWADALRWGAWLASGASLLGALVPLATRGDTRSLIGALALAGLLVIGQALTGRNRLITYLGSGMLLSAWLLAVFTYLPNQPQLYALPAGCYLLAIGAAERQRGAPAHQAQLLELLGMSVLLVVTFWQSLPSNLGYAMLLGLQTLLLIVLGALQRVRLLFFGGVIVFLINIAAQSVNSVQQIEKSLLAFGVGLILVVAAIYVERHRDDLLRRTRHMLTQLETWQ
jgi:hypothetical protein